MKVGLLTFHFVNNFGGALQAYALSRVVREKCNVEVEIIDYRNWFIRLTDRIRLFPVTTNIREFISGCKTMGKRVERRNKFGLFTKKYNIISRKYINRWQLIKYKPDADKYICGSDQIWNPIITCGVSYNYFLRFEPLKNNRISYAPSFGTVGISKVYEKRIKKYIEGIGFLSVREKSGAEYIKKLTGREAIRLIDPTFLLERNEWEKVAHNPLKSDEPYILLYIMQRDDEVYNYAKKIKEILGVKLVEISRYGYKPDYVDETLVDVGPSEFLGLFRDASYICTNSYHGFAYSIIFEKEFCLVPCKRFKARIENLFELLHISNSQIYMRDDLKGFTAEYNKEEVRMIISKEKEKAISFLKKSLES